MPVQNFLEDEEYESQNTDSSVPNFLQEEDYEAGGGDEYYGGGFEDGAQSAVDRTDFFESYGEEDVLEADGEEELFEGGELFEDAQSEGEDYSPYGISGLPSRSVVDSVVTESTVDGTVADYAESATTPPSEAQSSVPNFLEDEDEEAAAPRTVAEEQPARARRDLSRRPAPSSDGGKESSTPSPTPREDTPRAISTTPATTNPIPSAKLSPTVAVSFEAGAAVEPLTESEADELKTPSSYAVKRDPKFTALKQSDSTVRKVGADGLTSAERARAVRTTVPGSIRTPQTGKLSEEEILFYANLGSRRVGDYGSASKRQLFLPPALAESAEQKRERETRINRALAAGSVARGARSRLTEKDYRVLRFIALFKFSSERQIAKLLQVGEHSAYKRLNGLRKHGLTKGFKTLGVKGSVWMLTETGMDLSGFDLPRGTESALTLSMVSHQFTVNHVAAHLWSGGANVLREKNFPQRNLPDGSGGFDFGEQLISELQIQSAFGKVRGSSKAEAYVPQIKKHLANQFDSWQRAGGVGFGPSPELQRGNEYMWTLFPPISNRLNYHVPDLVVARPRSADGKPQSIAVEVELKTKADDSSYERTLDAYRSDDSIYRKVVWVCRLKGTAEKLTRIAKRNGLADQGRIAIVPIYLEDGSRFTGKDTWSL